MSDKPVFPKHIFGLHEPGGEWLMEQKGKKGWIVFTERVFHDPNDQYSMDYTPWSGRGFGIIARINHDYYPGGTLPLPQDYDNFALRVRNFVRGSKGCAIWVIGNEMNHGQERPQGQPITPQLYAQCYKKCWDQIHKLPGHENDQVAIGSVAPWNNTTAYPGNEIGDWVRYFLDILNEIRKLNCPVDAITLHTYTHGRDPNLVFSEQKMDAPFNNYRYHFRCYRDFMNVIPQSLRNVPVYITETDEDDEWEDANRGWVQNAYREINDWNNQPGNQQIRALVLYRWPRFDKWYIDGRFGVQEDFKTAMNNEYVWKEVQLPVQLNGFAIEGAFLDFFNRVGQEVCGLPISARVTEDGLPTQYFERLVLQQDKSGKVILRAAGKEVQQLRRTALEAQNQLQTVQTEKSNLQDRLYEVETALIQIKGELARSSAAGSGPVSGARSEPAARPAESAAMITEIVQPLWQDVVYQLPTHPTERYATRDLSGIKYIIIHHSAVPGTVPAADIAKFHTKNANWPGIGYHFYLDDQGRIFQTNELITTCYHVGNLDPVSIGVCVGGNFTKTIPTPAQIKNAAHLVAWLLQEFKLPLDAIKGKKEFIDTQSPGLQWLSGQNWKNLLLAQVAQAQQTQAKAHLPKSLEHYVLFWQTANAWAEKDWLAAQSYIGRFRSTHGFSADDARHARYVTIVGGTDGVDQKAEQMLLDAGCRVERIVGVDTVATANILADMARRGQRFLSLVGSAG